MSAASTTIPALDHRNQRARLLTEQMVETGAVMVTAGPTFSFQVVGHLVWLGRGQLLWCDAERTFETGAHVLHFDALCAIARRCVAFFLADEIVSCLCDIDAPDITDFRRLRPVHEGWIARLNRAAVCAGCKRLHSPGAPSHCRWQLCGEDGTSRLAATCES